LYLDFDNVFEYSGLSTDVFQQNEVIY